MLPISKNTQILFQKAPLANFTLQNRIVFHPMEGCDSLPCGSPSELTTRRYLSFANGGAGLIWFEAVAVVHEGRANPRQLWLNEKNLDNFKQLVSKTKEKCLKENGFEPVIIMQATHSGRYSKPNDFAKPEPLIAYNNPIFEKEPIDKSRLVTDDYLKRLEQAFATATKLSALAGFDGIDVKCCHRYLASELCSAYTRGGEYGGSFENRTRFISNAVNAAKAAADKGFLVTSRVNLYDGFSYPYGFGVNEKQGLEPNFSEGLQLLKNLNLELVNITCGNPYINPEVNRPVRSLKDYEERVLLLLNAAKAVRESLNIDVVCSGISGLGLNAPLVGAGAIEQNFCTLAGFGRLTFAYPNFIKDIKTGLNPNKICLTCAKCSAIMRAGGTAGCVLRDEFYFNHFKEITK
jgi:2,4-dienoyl-CoA reductase-like NADH-dependent reductase (Old Yellow Enzyme family)